MEEPDMEEIKGKYQLPKADQEEFTEAVMNLLKVTVEVAKGRPRGIYRSGNEPPKSYSRYCPE